MPTFRRAAPACAADSACVPCALGGAAGPEGAESAQGAGAADEADVGGADTGGADGGGADEPSNEPDVGPGGAESKAGNAGGTAGCPVSPEPWPGSPFPGWLWSPLSPNGRLVSDMCIPLAWPAVVGAVMDPGVRA